MKKYSKMLTIIKPNDVLYSRDIHAINIVNTILMSDNISVEHMDNLVDILYKVLHRNNINFINEDSKNLFMIQEDGWNTIIKKKNGVFVTKDVYEYLKENKLDDFIYNTKLLAANVTHMKNLDLNENMVILNDDYIDDIKLLAMNGHTFNSNMIYEKDEYIKLLINKSACYDGHLDLFLNIFTGNIDDLEELHNMLKNDPYTKGILKNVKITMMFVNDNKYNKSRITYYNNINTCSYGILDLFDKNLLNKINLNNV